MKKINYRAGIVCAALLATLQTSCVKDEGSYEMAPINEVTIGGLESSYSKIAYSETLDITPDLSGSIAGKDESRYTYKWLLKLNNVTQTEEPAIVIGTERNLHYTVEVAPGNYILRLQVADAETGLKWEQATSLDVVSPYVRGFYLFGDKEDGTVGIDFVSMLDGRDTTVISDLFTNTPGLKGAENLTFTGDYYNADRISLWATTRSGSYSLQFSSELPKIDVIPDITPEKLIFPTIPIARPIKIVDVFPHPFKSGNSSRSGSTRLLMTEHEFYCASITLEEAYDNPKNRYSAISSELFEPAPYVFYQGNSSYISRIYLYDKTNHRFVGMNSGFSFATNCKTLSPDTEQPFYFDQTHYTPVRDLVYAENGFGNSGRSYALMKDSNNDYFVYGFTAGYSLSKNLSEQVDKSLAQGFDRASHYAFFSMQPIVLYSVGSQLWAYDYRRKDAKMIRDFGSEITYLAMDYDSAEKPTDFIVATYDATNKGVVRKFTLADDQNKIEVTPHEKEVWNTGLRVVKVEYRNSAM